MTVLQAQQEAALRFEGANSRIDAAMLLAQVLDRDRVWLLAHPEEVLNEHKLQQFNGFVARRAAHEPLQYIFGTQEFYGLKLRVTPDVLIPRAETELLVKTVLCWAGTVESDRPLQIADVGTGSGAIAIALAMHIPKVMVFATDISAAALGVAHENAITHGCAERIRFVECDLLSGLEPEIYGGLRLDALVSNPPYVPASDAATMQPEVVDYEPHGALFAGDAGLSVYKRLIPAAHRALRSGGLLALEIGFGQRDAIAALLADWKGVEFFDDYNGIPRVVTAERL